MTDTPRTPRTWRLGLHLLDEKAASFQAKHENEFVLLSIDRETFEEMQRPGWLEITLRRVGDP